MKSALNLTLAFVAAWVLAGCTALRLAYDNADTYLLFRAKSYLDLARELLARERDGRTGERAPGPRIVAAGAP